MRRNAFTDTAVEEPKIEIPKECIESFMSAVETGYYKEFLKHGLITRQQFDMLMENSFVLASSSKMSDISTSSVQVIPSREVCRINAPDRILESRVRPLTFLDLSSIRCHSSSEGIISREV